MSVWQFYPLALAYLLMAAWSLGRWERDGSAVWIRSRSASIGAAAWPLVWLIIGIRRIQQ